MRQSAPGVSIHAGHQLNDNYLATLEPSIIRAAVYQGLYIRTFMLIFSLVDTGQDADTILSLMGIAVSCVFGKQSGALFAEFLK